MLVTGYERDLIEAASTAGSFMPDMPIAVRTT